MSTSRISETTTTSASYWICQFQLQQDMNDAVQAQLKKAEEELDRLRQVIADAKALHRESKWSGTVSYCVMCAERWPCASMRILCRSEVELVAADHG